jgi:hypothetical protein
MNSGLIKIRILIIKFCSCKKEILLPQRAQRESHKGHKGRRFHANLPAGRQGPKAQRNPESINFPSLFSRRGGPDLQIL